MTSIDRPPKITTAIKLLYIGLGIEIGVGIILVLGILVKESYGFIAILFLVIGLIIRWFLIYQTGKRHNWARIVFLVLFIVTLLFLSSPLFPLFIGEINFLFHPTSYNDTVIPITIISIGLLDISRIVLDIIAFSYLFQKPSSNWFRFRENQPYNGGNNKLGGYMDFKSGDIVFLKSGSNPMTVKEITGDPKILLLSALGLREIKCVREHSGQTN